MNDPSALLRDVRTLYEVGTLGALTDGQLLGLADPRRGEAAGLAFAELVARHGPMVLRVCRKVLRDPHAADDAFQATFLVLARKGRSLRVGDSLGPWLHGVAYRVSLGARAAEARRRRHERLAAKSAPAVAGGSEPDDLGEVLHEEVERLPERYRSAIVLCHLEGLTQQQAARRLGWPLGTLQSRLARGRDRLRDRLTRRGLAPAAATLGAAAPPPTVPPTLVESTLKLASGSLAAGTVPAAVAALVDGALRAMLMNKLKAAAAFCLALGLLTATGVGVLARQEPGPEPRDTPRPAAPPDVATDPPAARPGDDSPANPPVAPPGVAESAPTPAPVVLVARLRAALLQQQFLDQMARAGSVPPREYAESVGEVAILRAELEALKQDLEDELEQCRARLKVKEAEFAGERSLEVIAAAKASRLDRMATQGAVTQEEALEARAELDYRKARIMMKEAERAEVQVRCKQIERRLDSLRKIDPDKLEPADAPRVPGEPAPPPPPA